MSKDSQRSKVYEAENNWKAKLQKVLKHTVSLEEAQEILDSLAKEFRVRPITIQKNARIQAWGGWYSVRKNAIEVPRVPTPITTVLHEFAHHLDYNSKGYGRQGHGPSYTERMLEVIRQFWGSDASFALEECYEQCGVRVGVTVAAQMKEKYSTALERRRARHGETAEAYCIRTTWRDYNYDSREWIEIPGYLMQDRSSITKQVTEAGVWKLRSTAEKHAAAEAQLTDKPTTVVKVWAQLDTLHANRWWASHELEEEI